MQGSQPKVLELRTVGIVITDDLTGFAEIENLHSPQIVNAQRIKCSVLKDLWGSWKEREGVTIKMSVTTAPSFLPALREETEFSKLCFLSEGQDTCSQLLPKR